jgi:hypothetical protein
MSDRSANEERNDTKVAKIQTTESPRRCVRRENIVRYLVVIATSSILWLVCFYTNILTIYEEQRRKRIFQVR